MSQKDKGKQCKNNPSPETILKTKETVIQNHEKNILLKKREKKQGLFLHK
jgi:hypothetical protein